MGNCNKTLVIIPCGKKKIWSKNKLCGSVKAEEAYVSNYFKLCKLYAKRFADKWVILSGKYGIIEPGFIIDNDYDIKLKPTEEFKIKVKDQLKPFILDGFTNIVSLCSDYYSDFLKDIIKQFGLKLNTPLRGLKIGIRQKKLKISLGNDKPLKR